MALSARLPSSTARTLTGQAPWTIVWKFQTSKKLCFKIQQIKDHFETIDNEPYRNINRIVLTVSEIKFSKPTRSKVIPMGRETSCLENVSRTLIVCVCAFEFCRNGRWSEKANFSKWLQNIPSSLKILFLLIIWQDFNFKVQSFLQFSTPNYQIEFN